MQSSNIDLDIQLNSHALSAITEFKRSNSDWTGKHLRIYLSGKNCDGFEYGACFDDIGSDDLFKIIDEDTNLICDEKSYEFVKGSTVNFVDDERGKGFLIENPLHKKYRGKFFKRKSWSEKQPKN